jgi:uncharacterized membrane protein YkgB
MAEAPSRRDRTKPAELLGLSAGLAVFVALVTMLASREPLLALIALGVVFILSIVTLATLALTVNASPEERVDLDEQDRGQGH